MLTTRISDGVALLIVCGLKVKMFSFGLQCTHNDSLDLKFLKYSGFMALLGYCCLTIFVVRSLLCVTSL